MALITCEDCQKEHSDEAKMCPWCSKPNGSRPNWFQRHPILSGIFSLWFLAALIFRLFDKS